MEVFRNRFKDLRKNKNLTQIELSKELRTTNSSVCDWEKGRSEPDLQTLVNIAKFFNVSIDYLLGLED